MALEAPGMNVGYLLANTDISASQYCAVFVTGADLKVDLQTSGAGPCLGILQNKPIAGQAADVRFSGVSKAKTGASYSRGVLLMSDGSGRLILATATNTAIAYALEASGAANELRTVLVMAGPSFKLP